MNSASVYVVIVVYNPREWIDRCFSSLRESSIHVKTVVIDNGSIDGSQEIIKQNYPEVEFYQAKKNLGFGLGNNLGIKMAYDARADYVFLLNQDAWVETDTIELLKNKMQEDSSYGVLSPMHLNGNGNALDFNFSTYIEPSFCSDLYSDIYLKRKIDRIYDVQFVNAAAWMMSRACIDKVGGFSPSFFHYGEDYNYVHRLHFYQIKLGVYPLTRICHDRAQRVVSKYFSNYGVVTERAFISFYSDPLIDVSFIRGQIELLRYLISSILNCRFKDAWEIVKKWALLFMKINFLKANRKRSMKGEEQCFLPSSMDQFID